MKKIKMIAHRGYSAVYPANTEPAFTQAALHGSDGAETDIRRTKDGVYVTCHDPEAVFSDGSVLTISDATFAQLTAKPLRNKLTDETVYLCSFRRYLEIMRDNDMICFIELKGEYDDAQIREVFSLAAEVYDLSKCIMQSFSFENLIRVRKFFPELPLMLTFGEKETGWERCFDYGISLDAEYTVLTEEMQRRFREAGLEIAVWTVNDERALAYCRTLDIDYIESDCFGGADVLCPD